MTMSRGLTKSTFVKGWFCEKLFWFSGHELEAPEWTVPPMSAFRIAEGNRVGVAARERFPGGVLIDCAPGETARAVERTDAAIRDGAPAIFEAGFEHDGIHVRVDVLENRGNGLWRAIEVKSSSEVKERHKADVAVQWHVLSGAGLPLEGIDLMHLNPGCRHPDLSNLFVRRDLTTLARAIEGDVVGKARFLEEVALRPDVPERAVGRQCRQVLDEGCPFLGRCEGTFPPWHVMNLHGKEGKPLGRKLYASGVASMAEIDPETEGRMSPVLRRQVASIRTGGPVVDGEQLRRFLGEVVYPLYYLDFETIQPAIPRYPGTAPNQQIPVQFSCHVRHADGTVEHLREFLTESSDPLPEFADAMLETLGDTGTIAVYYRPFEEGRIVELAEALPDRRERLCALRPRLWDLCEITRETVYHPDFLGSFSIKKTLPILVPGDGYKGLAIAEGGSAMAAYARLTDPATGERERAVIRADLLRYCRQDTQAMVDIHRALEAMV